MCLVHHFPAVVSQRIIKKAARLAGSYDENGKCVRVCVRACACMCVFMCFACPILSAASSRRLTP